MDIPKTSITKLKMLIEALDLVHDVDDDWLPDQRAWKRIKGMIETLEEQPKSASHPTKTYRAGMRDDTNPVTNGTLRLPEVPVSDAVIVASEQGTSALAQPDKQPVDQPVGDDGRLADGTLVENPPVSPGL